MKVDKSVSHFHSKEEVIALVKAGKRAVDRIESRGGEWLGKVRN